MMWSEVIDSLPTLFCLVVPSSMTVKKSRKLTSILREIDFYTGNDEKYNEIVCIRIIIINKVKYLYT